MSERNILSSLKPALPAALVALLMSGCSILPGAPAKDAETPSEKVDASSLRGLADKARAERAKTLASQTAPATPTGKNASAAKAIASRAASDADDEAPEPMKTASAGRPPQTDHRAAALALLRNRPRPPAGEETAPSDPAPYDLGRPKTYRLDGPAAPQNAQQNTTQPPAYAQAAAPGYAGGAYASPAYGVPRGENGQPVASYPRTPAPALEPPTQLADASGFQPPDPAAPRQSDPRALMEAVERLRQRQALQPAKTSPVASPAPEATGSISPPAAEFVPASPLTFVQFDKGEVTLPASGRATIAEMLKPFLKEKGDKVVAAMGLGGQGEAYTKLLQANQRAQAVAEAVPPAFELIRRFDPTLPNESVRLFVVRSGT